MPEGSQPKRREVQQVSVQPPSGRRIRTQPKPRRPASRTRSHCPNNPAQTPDHASQSCRYTGHWPWRAMDPTGRRTPSRRHARPVSRTANARAIARPRGFAGVATASRSDIPFGRPPVRSCCRSTKPSPTTSGRPPRPPPINPSNTDRSDQELNPHPQRPTQTHTQQLIDAPQLQRHNRNSPTPENDDHRASPSTHDQCTNKA